MSNTELQSGPIYYTLFGGAQLGITSHGMLHKFDAEKPIS
jgi:hypothetical protein